MILRYTDQKSKGENAGCQESETFLLLHYSELPRYFNRPTLEFDDLLIHLFGSPGVLKKCRSENL